MGICVCVYMRADEERGTWMSGCVSRGVLHSVISYTGTLRWRDINWDLKREPE